MIPKRLRPKPTPEWSQVVMLGATGLRMALSLGLTMLVGRFLTPQEFGGFALIATVFGLAHEFTDMGTGNVAVRAAARERAGERRILEQLLSLRLVLSLIAALACVGLALAQSDAMLRGMLLAVACVLGFSYVSAFSVVFQLRQAQAAPAALSVLVQVATLVGAAVLLVALRVGGGWLPVVIILREAATAACTQALAVRLLGYVPWPRLRRAALRPLSGTAAIVALATLAYHFQLQGGLFWVQLLRPAEELGAFGAALRPLAPLLFVPWVLMLPLVPLLSWLIAHDRAAFRRQAQSAVDLSAGLGAVIAVVSLQLAAPLMQFLYGARFSAGPLQAVDTLRWLAAPLGFSFVSAALSTALLADHREGALLRLSGLGFALYAAANLVLVPRFGFAGSAMATALAMGTTTLGGLWMGWRAAGILPGPRTALVLLPAALLFPLLQILPGPAAAQLALGALLAGAALLAVWCLPGLRADRAEQVLLTARALADEKTAVG